LQFFSKNHIDKSKNHTNSDDESIELSLLDLCLITALIFRDLKLTVLLTVVRLLLSTKLILVMGRIIVFYCEICYLINSYAKCAALVQIKEFCTKNRKNLTVMSEKLRSTISSQHSMLCFLIIAN